ncbi:MAG: hypothetical protein H0U76_18670 [Ktedonobacteraceae bacterium]|nr:hypothetical protein [Ktedonobacteraceae bacterium]
MLLIDTQKQINRMKKALDITKYPGMMAVIRWFKRPFVQHLLILITSTLLAMSFGMWCLSSSHTSVAQSASFKTYATAPSMDKFTLSAGAEPIGSEYPFLSPTPKAYSDMVYASLPLTGVSRLQARIFAETRLKETGENL